MITKTLRFIEWGLWESPGLHAVVELSEYEKISGLFIGSTWANPYKPSNPNLKTSKAYASIAEGLYVARFLQSAHNGKVGFDIRTIKGEYNGAIPTTASNPNQGGQVFAKNVDIHSADSDIWEGSAACLTIDIHCWLLFIAYFSEKEEAWLKVERIKT